MKEIILNSLEEFNQLEKVFTEKTLISIKFSEWAYVEAWENSYVEARGNSQVEAWGNSHVVARENSYVEARENSHVVAWANSYVKARENSHVEARDNSHVVAWANSHVEARDNSQVEAWENSQVEAWENSQVEAWGNSHVVARGNSQVEAWGNSQVEAWGKNSIYNFSENTSISLMFLSICFLDVIPKKKIKKGKFTKIIKIPENTVENYLELNDVRREEGEYILFKRVSIDFKTQERTENETVWKIGETLTHKYFNPEEECGKGKFHACSRPFFCDEFRNNERDIYIAISVKKEDLFAHKNPIYPHKISFREGKVLYQVDREGNRICDEN